VDKYASKAKFITSFAKFLLIYYQMVLLVGLLESGLVGASGVSPANIIPPLFSMLTYHLGVKH
jgi:hypothetical protein